MTRLKFGLDMLVNAIIIISALLDFENYRSFS